MEIIKHNEDMNTYKKQNYLAPWTDVFFIRCELAFLGSATIEDLPGEDEYDFDN